jgi:hypothetical protein
MIPSVYAILDTSVLVAGLRSRNGASFQVLRAIRRGDIRIAVSVALVLEYEAVTLRPGMVPGFRPVDILGILDGICLLADHQQIFSRGGRSCEIQMMTLSSSLLWQHPRHLSSRITQAIFAARTRWESGRSHQQQPLT